MFLAHPLHTIDLSITNPQPTRSPNIHHCLHPMTSLYSHMAQKFPLDCKQSCCVCCTRLAWIPIPAIIVAFAYAGLFIATLILQLVIRIFDIIFEAIYPFCRTTATVISGFLLISQRFTFAVYAGDRGLVRHTVVDRGLVWHATGATTNPTVTKVIATLLCHRRRFTQPATTPLTQPLAITHRLILFCPCLARVTLIAGHG